MRCTECGYEDYQYDLDFCPQCNNAISDPSPTLPLVVERSSLPTLPQESRLARAQSLDTGGGNASLQRVYRDLYESVEAVERGDPLWEFYGKHLAAYKAKQEAKGTYEELVKIKQAAYLEMKRQIARAELAWSQAQFTDAIQREQLMRRARLLTDLLDMINQVFAADKYANLHDEIKADLINSLYKHAEDMVFTEPNMPVPNGRPLSGSADDRVTIINVDEF